MAWLPATHRSPRAAARVVLSAVALVLSAIGALPAPPAGFPAAAQAVLDRPALRCAHVGAIVVSLPSGAAWYSSNADRLFVPASNAKLFVAAAALDRLGPEFRYRTAVLAEREPADGILRGDLFLKGSGDPTILFTHLAALAESVKALGISRVSGRVVGDESAFDSVRYGAGWMYEDLPWYYAPEISALSFNGNSALVVVRAGPAPGSSARVSVSPPSDYLRIENECVTTAAGSPAAVSIERLVGAAVVVVSGSIGVGARPVSQRVSVPDPALWTAHVFRERLLAAGVQVDGEAAVGLAPAGAVALARHESPPLKEMIAVMLKQSDNHMAEQVLKTLGLQVAGRGTTEAGLGVVNDFLLEAGATSGCPPHLADGSGLSRYNLASPRHIAGLLLFMDRHRFRKAWLDALPAAGVSGTMERRLAGSPARSAVRAKTGTMFAVSALSGYAVTRSGRRAAFSILVNGYPGPVADIRRAQDDLVEELARRR